MVAAALVSRFRDADDVGPALRGAADLRWLVFRPEAPVGNPWWSDGHAASEALLAGWLDECRQDGVRRVHADKALPVPGVHGVPEQWPHVRDLLLRHGFAPDSTLTTAIHVLPLDQLAEPGPPPVDGLVVRRSVGINGVRLAAFAGPDGERVGYVEVATLETADRLPRGGGLADIGNLRVAEGPRRVEVANWLVRHAAAWLRLGHVDRLLHYTDVAAAHDLGLAAATGFIEVARTTRGWQLELAARGGPAG